MHAKILNPRCGGGSLPAVPAGFYSNGVGPTRGIDGWGGVPGGVLRLCSPGVFYQSQGLLCPNSTQLYLLGFLADIVGI